MSEKKWVEVPASALEGEGLAPYPAGDISSLFDWMEKPDASSTHLMPWFGQFIVDVVEMDDNAVHQPSKPGDEVVIVLNGILSLKTDGTQDALFIGKGEAVLIPQGWAGIYRVIAKDGPFRELAIVPENYFDPAYDLPPSGKAPRKLDLSQGPGTHQLHRNRYALEVRVLDRDESWRPAGTSDEIIHVLDGMLRLDTATFSAGSVVILPAGFTGQAESSAGYRALHARWIG